MCMTENKQENLTGQLLENTVDDMAKKAEAEKIWGEAEIKLPNPHNAATPAVKMSWWGRHFGFMSAEAKLWFWSVLLLMICGGFYLGFWYACQQEEPIDVPYVTATNFYADKAAAEEAMKGYLGEDELLTILMLGCDMREGESSGRADTIMLAFVNIEDGAVNLLSIPRDTRVELAEGRGTTKINHAYAYGGMALTRKTISQFLDVEIDRYVQVDFEGFAGIIDALGGVEYNVEQRMYKPEENIDLQPGLQKLDGKKALAYVRWRGTPTADIGRIERQQKFLNAVLDQLMSSGTIFKLPKLMGEINESVTTDFKLSELKHLVEKYKEFPSVSFASDKLPGEDTRIEGISYWKYYPNQTAALVQQMKNFTLPDNDAPTPDENNGTAQNQNTGV